MPYGANALLSQYESIRVTACCAFYFIQHGLRLHLDFLNYHKVTTVTPIAKINLSPTSGVEYLVVSAK
jgi:hypothetical protein